MDRRSYLMLTPATECQFDKFSEKQTYQIRFMRSAGIVVSPFRTAGLYIVTSPITGSVKLLAPVSTRPA